MIAQSKIRIPQVRKSLVSRPKLMRKLDMGLKTKLTLVSAQAGYGKTTGISEWAKQQRVAHVAWVSLDKLDSDWSQFWSCVIAAIREPFPGFGESIAFLLEKESESLFETAMTAFANEWIKIPEELILVLDDFHFIDLPAIHQSLSYLLGILPSHFHLFIASRTDLPIPTARLLAKGEINVIRMQDLRFELEEGMVFFRDTTDLKLTKEQVTALHHQTEGWVSGLQLAAITLNGSGNITASISQFNGQQRHISDYLLEEVYQHLNESLRRFLLETSLLSRMNASLCEAATGQVDSQEQLERLERLNLFIIPLDEGRHWYRYHHLLSDFLRRIAAGEDPDRWKMLHTRVANWFEKQGMAEEAVEHYIQGGQSEDAVRIIEHIFPEYLQLKSTVMMRWIVALPESSYRDKPMLEMFYITKLVGDGKWESAIPRVEQAEIRFEALRMVMPESAWKQVMGNLYYFCGILSYLQQNLTRASHYFELVESYLPEGSSFQHMGSKRYQGYDQFTDLLSLNNDFVVVEQFLQKWIQTWRSKEDYPFVGYQYVTYCALLYEWNRLEEAEAYLGEALGRVGLRSNMWLWIQLNLAFAQLRQATGQESGPSEWLLRLKSNIDSPDYELIVRRIEAEQALFSLRQGLLQHALDWSETSGLSPEDEVSLHHLAEHLILARVLIASDCTEEALNLLERLYLLINQDNRLRDRIHIRLLQSMGYRISGLTEASLEKLTLALTLAEPVGYIRSFVDEGEIMLGMLDDFMKARQEESVTSVSPDYVERLLKALKEAPSHKPSPKKILTKQEMKILILLADGLLNKEIADRLQITSGTVKFHLKNVYRKLEAHNRIQALQQAKQLGLFI
ncbi:LuxR family transcriptional regulator, maltose regulon positive regulatory protein [Paenibacillus algorifonticola]|uniref:LuxR family transcriptional regulator, maltose regulon positive regulatory protein n=1 Tax=Paenibacillus algorifonticola TaxID=684063 RepID=A0A1I2CJJ0_9BACL|nr:LuxR C-terminal-related transcriptional regulator [Paenibacillus algorifonticola]SFE68424.1 LuxR family transcriptional regulator, maltose regulon positive regulatory protein [Paenibacillus algorifonticola]